LTAGEARLLSALRAGSPDSPGLPERYPALEPGLRMLAETESYAPGSAAYDGNVGACAPMPERWSVTALQRFGRCPLQHFFRDVLHVEEMEEEASRFEIPARELGIEVHRVLERVWGALADEGAADAATPHAALARIDSLLDEAWPAVSRSLGDRLNERLPVLWSRVSAGWLDALRKFLREDVARVIGSGLRPAGLELRLAREIDLDRGRTLPLVGRLDRRLESGDGTVVGDYKSGGNLRRRCDATGMLKGLELQVPLYRLLADDSADVELLGVGPEFDFETEDAEEAGRRGVFRGFANDRVREGFLETLRVLAELRRRGRFPLRAEEHRCAWCAYRAACRRLHPPTLEREENAQDLRPFRLLDRKNKTRRPLLDDLESGPTAPTRDRS
jgi:hypothetical protein